MFINNKKFYALSLSVYFSCSALAHAAGTMNARDFIAAPPGTSLAVLYYENEGSNEFSGVPASANENLDVNALLYRQLWFTDICGTLCTPQFILPYADVYLRMPFSPKSSSSSGFGDPLFGGAIYISNNPQQKYYSAFLTLVSLPVGKYDSLNPDSSPGSNRWEVFLTYNNTISVGEEWVFEANLEAELYGNNDDYLGSKLEQSPLLSAQLIASYDISSSVYGAASVIHSDGGEMELDGYTLPDTTSRETRLGAELGYSLSRRNTIMASYSKIISSTNAFESDKVLLRFTHVW